jgi:peptide/nickel transport system permease protein
MSRGEYLVRRLGLGILVVIGALMITFIVSYIVPGDPARLYLGSRATPEKLTEARHELGLDQPVPLQFVSYISRTLRGELGISLRTKRPISEDIKIRLPATLELVITSMVLALLMGLPVGVFGAARRGKSFDQFSRIVTIGGVSVPSFWLALILQLFFFLYLRRLPLGGRISNEIMLAHPIQTKTGFYLVDAAITGNWVAWWDALVHLILPVVVLATYPISLVVRMTRASMIEVLSETYITAARAAGLTEREILFKLALKNAIMPTLTVMGLLFAYSITGSVLVEVVFTWPGLGSYMADAILSSDIYVLFAVTLVVTLIYIGINLVVDILQAAIDPRVRLGERGDM